MNLVIFLSDSTGRVLICPNWLIFESRAFAAPLLPVLDRSGRTCCNLRPSKSLSEKRPSEG